jgi:hypothetical protein
LAVKIIFAYRWHGLGSLIVGQIGGLNTRQILGMMLVTHQTGPQGQKVQRLLIEETATLARVIGIAKLLAISL